MKTGLSLLFFTLSLLASVLWATPSHAQTPVAWWKFDEGTGTAASDASGNGNIGTLQAGASWASGLVGPYCVSLVGTATSYVDVPKTVIDTTKSYTVMGWVNVNQVSGYQTFVSIDGSTVSGFYLQLRGDTGKFALSVLASDATGTATEANATAAPVAGEWYHLAGVYDATAKTISLYVNGTLQQTVSYTAAWKAGGHTEIGRGKYGGSATDFVGGTIDDVRVYNAVLPAATINAIAQANLPPPPTPKLQVNAAQTVAAVSPTFYGMMTEEINHSYDGGLYGELIQNRIFQDSATAPVHWSLVNNGSASDSIVLEATQPISGTALTTCLKLTSVTASANQRVGVANDGFWGIPVKPNSTYQASFYAQASPGFTGPLTVDIESSGGSTVYAAAQVPQISTVWQKYTLTLTTGNVAPSEATRFVISANSPGTVWFNLVSLFPPTNNGRSNGNRIDLMQAMAGLSPSFLRLPGGNYLEGNTIATRFEWKNTIGPLEQRPGHVGPWGYRSSDGMGLLEFLEWCEDLHMQPVLAVYAGYSLDGEYVAPGTALQPYVQDALDEIQYVTGDVSTTWGAQRAADGHPAPFPLTYVEIGNEDFFDSSGSYNGRYTQFYNAIKSAYPSLKLIATTGVTSVTPDVYDDHYYKSPASFESDVHHYDSYSRTGPKIFVGEWASQEGTPTPDLNAALGDAAWLTGLEHDSDLIVLESYAPLFVNVNSGASQWGTNLIGYDALSSYGSPSYYIQAMFAANHGDAILNGVLTGIAQFYYSATRDSNKGTVYLKAVNTSGTAQTVQITLTGVATVAPSGKAITLTSASPSDTNTLTSPVAVVPVTTTATGLGTAFNYTFAPYSVTVLDIPLGPPVTTAALSGTMGTNGWYTSPVTVTLTAADPNGATYIGNTYYTIDGGSMQTYSAPFTITGDSPGHSVTFWSVDKGGSAEAINSLTIKIDGTAPTLTFGTASPAANAAGWNNAAVSLPYTATDATSGVASVTPASPLTFSAEGKAQTRTVTVTDNAGNVTTRSTPAISIDLTPPVTTAAVAGAQVTLNATDNQSGVAATFYTVDSGTKQAYSAPFTVTGSSGSHSVSYWSVDGAGNVETTHSVTVGVTAPPVTLYSLNYNSYWYFVTANQSEDNSLVAGGWANTPTGQVYQNQTDAPGLTPLYRLYYPLTGDHFYTTSLAEMNLAISYGYDFETIACYVFPGSVSGTIPLYRAYNPQTGQHRFTANAAEYNSLGPQWTQEGVQCYILPPPSQAVPPVPLYSLNYQSRWYFVTANQAEDNSLVAGGWANALTGHAYAGANDAPGLVPLYRLYYPPTGDHFYTTSLSERNSILPYGFSDEGIACYVFPAQVSGTVPLYRAYNPQTGQHRYTGSAAEYAGLPSPWQQEGAQCYILP